ncbi:gamma-type small acid-soluble spore protein [Neobacillus cucumis]|nr:gamma-type small acid-soluble spore protein [Neobacillus cucumis]
MPTLKINFPNFPGQFGTEFASETNAQEVRRQNQQSRQNNNQNS